MNATLRYIVKWDEANMTRYVWTNDITTATKVYEMLKYFEYQCTLVEGETILMSYEVM